MAVTAQEAQDGSGRSRAALGGLLADIARQRPGQLVIRDAPSRAGWSGRRPMVYDARAALAAVARLAGYLRNLPLPEAARVGICLPNGSEACLSLLAVERAGLTPCLLDAGLSAADMSAAIECADVRAVITQTLMGPDRLAEKLCFVAAGFFRLRFLLAFGPDVPDGVTDLDPFVDGTTPMAGDVFPEGGDGDEDASIVTLARLGGSPVAVRHRQRSLVANAGILLASALIRPGERLVSYLAPDDLKGLASGLACALVAGATFEPRAVFDSASIEADLAPADRPHMVLPAWLEGALVEARLFSRMRSATLVRDAPTSFATHPGSAGRIIDVVALGELCLLAGARAVPGRFGIPVEDQPAWHALIEVRIASAGTLLLRGPALPADPDDADGLSINDEWRSSGFRLEKLAGTVTGIA